MFTKTNNVKAMETLVIADGAAFGSEMEKMYYLIKENPHIRLYLPESFEWLLLEAGIISGTDVKEILEKTYDYVESEKHFSWEQYFTELIIQKTKDTYLSYSKRSLNDAYKEKKIQEAVKKVMEGICLEK